MVNNNEPTFIEMRSRGVHTSGTKTCGQKFNFSFVTSKAFHLSQKLVSCNHRQLLNQSQMLFNDPDDR